MTGIVARIRLKIYPAIFGLFPYLEMFQKTWTGA